MCSRSKSIRNERDYLTHLTQLMTQICRKNGPSQHHVYIMGQKLQILRGLRKVSYLSTMPDKCDKKMTI